MNKYTYDNKEYKNKKAISDELNLSKYIVTRMMDQGLICLIPNKKRDTIARRNNNYYLKNKAKWSK